MSENADFCHFGDKKLSQFAPLKKPAKLISLVLKEGFWGPLKKSNFGIFFNRVLYVSLCQSVGLSVITLFFLAFYLLSKLFCCTEEFLSKFLRLLNISETSLHF